MLTLFLSFAILCPAQAERPQSPKPGAFSASADLQYYTTTANYQNNGSSSTLLNGTSYSRFAGALGGTYDFTSHLRAFAAFSFANANSSNFDTVSATKISRDHTGLDEGAVGALAWWDLGPLALAPQAAFIYPFWRVDEESDSPLIGEGAMRLQAGTWAILRASQIFQPFVFGGFEYRDGGRSSLLNYAAGAHLQIKNWWLQGEYRGFSSITDDGDAGNPLDSQERDLYLLRVNGGSNRYYAVNPTLGELALETGFRLRPVSFYAGFAASVHGNNSGDGMLFYGGLTFNGRVKPSAKSRRETDPEDEFEIRDEQYDESLFMEDGGRKKIKKRIRKQKSVDKLLNETEKELE